MAEISQFERLIGRDPDAWKEIYPDYEPNDDVRVTKAKAVADGFGPSDRVSVFDPQSRAAAFQATPLSDADVVLAREKVGLDLGDVREVPGVIIGSSGTFQSLAEADAALSSGQTVSADQDARAEDASTQRPEPEATDSEEDDDLASGVRRREARQRNAAAAGEDVEPSVAPRRVDEFSQAGVGINNTPLDNEPTTVADDEGNETGGESEEDIAPDVILENTTIPGEFATELKSKPNVLSEFPSYSYSTSVYLMQPGDYNNMILTGEKRLFNSTLLLQSGGITGGAESDSSRRNSFFDVDFYINNIEIESLITGKATQGAHNATRIRFDVTEPYGISFLDRLRAAVSDFQGSEQNMFSQPYLMVIRFYGYDEAGNLVQPQNKPEETSDSNSVIEKFIPFIFENIKFTVANQSVVYECSAVAINQYVALGQITSTVPYNVEISGQTLTELLNGEPVIEASAGTNPGRPGGEAEERGSQTIRQGLVAALNRFEEEEAREKGALPNEYAIKLDESVGLANAKMAQSNEAYLANLPIAVRNNQTIAQQSGTNNNQRKYGIIAGQSIVQVLDLLVRASTYITDQQLVKFTEDPAENRNAGPNGSNKRYIKLRDGKQGPVAWFKITTHILPKEYDERRGEYSYKITYIISGFQVNDLKSEYFPTPEFRGVHKEYDYWFTGENTEVLDFEQQFNALYYLTMAPQEVQRTVGNDPRSNRNSTTKTTTQDITSESEIMGTGESAKPSADAASSLYSPSDQGIAEIKVLGDPAWIQQSEIFYSNNNGVNYAPFLPDDSINYDSQEPLFQISFNLPTDYDVNGSGTMPVRKFNQLEDFQPGSHRFIYRANRIVNSFSNGVFTQQISATQMFDTLRQQNNEDERFPLFGPRRENNIILPGTSSDLGSAPNADLLGPRRGSNPFGTLGIDFANNIDADEGDRINEDDGAVRTGESAAPPPEVRRENDLNSSVVAQPSGTPPPDSEESANNVIPGADSDAIRIQVTRDASDFEDD